MFHYAGVCRALVLYATPPKDDCDVVCDVVVGEQGNRAGVDRFTINHRRSHAAAHTLGIHDRDSIKRAADAPLE